MKKCIALLLIGLFILTGCAETENDSADLSSNNINQDDKIIELGYEKAEEFSSLYLKIRDELIFLNDEEKMRIWIGLSTCLKLKYVEFLNLMSLLIS